MKITWLGHSGFRIEIGGQILLVDPWLTGNPVFPPERRDQATEGATYVLATHGHHDHTTDAAAIAKERSIPVVGIYDLCSYLETTEGVDTVGFNKGGTVDLGGVAVTMVNAAHSSSIGTDHGPVYTGSEAGYMIAAEGHTLYVSGDTDIMADMGWMGELHQPDVGILCAGGHFTMDMARAAWAAKKYFRFNTLIPCHYKTFPLLEQSAEAMIAALPEVNVIEPEVLKAIEI